MHILNKICIFRGARHYSRRYAAGAEALKALQTASGKVVSQMDSTLQGNLGSSPKKGLMEVWKSFKKGFQDASEEFQVAFEEEALKLEQESIAAQEEKVRFEKDKDYQENPDPGSKKGLNGVWQNFLAGFQEGWEENSENDLKSEKGIDYTRLRNLLKAGKWREADTETYEVMIRAVDKKSGDLFTTYELANFPCTDLRTIDGLWVQYSQGKFGFSVQKKIYVECGAKLDGKYPGDQVWHEFCNRVGWRKGDSYLHDEDLKANPYSSPAGEFPWAWRGWIGGLLDNLRVGGTLLFSRTETCNL